MQKFGFVFPGQGSQKLGMLRALAAEYAIVEETFALASAAIGHDLWEISQFDSQNSLDQTQITQPTLLATSVAIWRVWQQSEAPMPSIMAGHSLGEYSALVCAGVLDFQDAIALVHKRGVLMQSAVPPGKGKMAAIVGLDNHQIQEICERCAQGQVVSPANFNSSGQTVIAGDIEAVERAMIQCKEAGAKRALPLSVSVPSHCALMKPAADKLEAELNAVEFKAANIPVIQNVNAEISIDSSAIKQNLMRQLYEPVLWVDSIRLIHKAEVAKLVECGPGKVLCGLIRRIESDLVCVGSDDPQSMTSAIDEVSA